MSDHSAEQGQISELASFTAYAEIAAGEAVEASINMGNPQEEVHRRKAQEAISHMAETLGDNLGAVWPLKGMAVRRALKQADGSLITPPSDTKEPIEIGPFNYVIGQIEDYRGEPAVWLLTSPNINVHYLTSVKSLSVASVEEIANSPTQNQSKGA